jgi:hypothetical protein
LAIVERPLIEAAIRPGRVPMQEGSRLADNIKGLIAVLAPEALCDPYIADRLKIGSAH